MAKQGNGKWWEKKDLIRGGDPDKIELEVILEPPATLHIQRYFIDADDHALPLKRQPTITADNVQAVPSLLNPIILWLVAVMRQPQHFELTEPLDESLSMLEDWAKEGLKEAETTS